MVNEQNLESKLRDISSDLSIPMSSLLELFSQSVTEYLSMESGLSLSIDFDFDNANYAGQIHALRKITEEGIGFGEISKDFIEKYIANNPEKGLFAYENLNLGSIVKQKLRQISFKNDQDFFSRNALIKINNELKNKITHLHKEKEYRFFIDKVGELISGRVSRIEGENVVLNLGFGEGFLSKREMIQSDMFSVGTTVQAYIYEVTPETHKYQVKLTRTKPEFLACLMESMIPEIENGLIEIKAVARDPGSRSKVAVYADEYTDIHAVGSCIGKEGIRIKAVRAALGNERIDVILWDPVISRFIENALNIEHGSIKRIVEHEGSGWEIVIDADDLILSRFNRQQLRLVSRLVKQRIKKITSKREADEREKKEKAMSVQKFAELGLDSDQINILLSKNIDSIGELLDAEPDFISTILEKDSAYVADLIQRAQKDEEEALLNEYSEAGVDFQLSEVPYIEGIEPEIFRDKGILTKKDLAEKDIDEVMKLFRAHLSKDIELAEQQCEDIVRWSRDIGRDD